MAATQLSLEKTTRTITVVMWWLLLTWVVLATAIFGVWMAAEGATANDRLFCPVESSASIYGEAHWSWTELGRVCSWQLGAFSQEKGPGYSRWIIVAGLSAAWIALAVTGRSHRRRSRQE